MARYVHLGIFGAKIDRMSCAYRPTADCNNVLLTCGCSQGVPFTIYSVTVWWIGDVYESFIHIVAPVPFAEETRLNKFQPNPNMFSGTAI